MQILSTVDPKVAVAATRGPNAIIQFLIVIYYGMSLSVAEFGQLSILMILIGLNYGFIDFGTNNTIVTKNLTKLTYTRLQSLNFFFAFSLGLIYFVLSKIEFNLFNFGLNFSKTLAYFLPLLIIYSLTIVPYARLHKALRLKQLALVDFFPVLSMLFTVPMFLNLGFGITTLMLSVGIQVLLRFIVLKFFYGQIIRLSFINNIPYMTLARQYLSNLVVYMTSKLDQLMVASFLSAETLGFYSFLKQILNYPISLLIAIYSQITFPFFSRYRRTIKRINRTLISALMILSSIVFFYFALLALIPPDFMQKSIEMWDFRGELAFLIMGLSFSRILFDALSTMSIAVGFIAQQLKINICYLLLVLVCGLLLPLLGLSNYLLILISSALRISIFIYISTFNKLKSG